MGTLPRNGRCETTTTASPDDVWAIVGDPTRVGEWSHECGGAEWIDGATTARPGARFRGRNKVGRSKWARVCELVTVDAPHELAWRTVPTRLYPDSTLWTITIEATDTGSRIEQRFEVLKLNPALERLFYLLIPPHRDRSEALRADLVRLGAAAERVPARPS
jgi:uncharacterized protein YndB with AHSA1/START domain